MKKLNKKGVTLIELIVSFAIVSIAMIYFYQTIVDLHRMYKNSNKATDEFVNKDYALRVLDAWATKSDNNLSDLLSTAPSQVKICDMYNMACDDGKTRVESNKNFKKITLMNSSDKELAVYYKYEKTLVDLKLESKGALDEYGNVNDLSSMGILKEDTTNDQVTVEIDSNGIITYKIIDNNSKEKYTKTNTNTIKEIIESDTKLEKTEDKINEKVQKLVGKDYTIKESVEEIETGVYASVYNIVDENGNTKTKNIYKINDLIKIDESNASDYDINNLFKELNPQSYEATENENINKLYSMKFKLTSTRSDRDCWAILYNELAGNKVDYYVKYNLKDIESVGKMISLINDKKIVVQYEKGENKGEYYLTFSKFKNDNATEPAKHFIKVYNFAKTPNTCKMKLLEAYKYK